MDPLDLECVMAAVGPEKILRGKPTFHKYQLEAAANLPKEIRKRVLRFLAVEEFGEAVDLPPFDYHDVLKLVSSDQTPDEARALLTAVPDHELATDMSNMANGIRLWARTAIPREVSASIVGPRLEEPDPGALMDFRRLWQVATDPMAAIADLEDGSLTEEQVATVALLYPGLHGEMRQAVSDALATMGGRRGKTWEPAPIKATLVGILRQQDASDHDLAAAVQQMYAQEAQAQQQAQPAPTKPGQVDPRAEMTPGQKAAGT